MTGQDAMMKFRTVYLQAIAKAWNDKKFLDQLKKDPIGILERTFGFQFPWDVNLEIESVPATESLWDPVNAGGWVGRNAVISLWIPPPPKKEEDWAKAWAAYYDRFPSFLGSRSSIPAKDDGPVLRESYPLGMGNWKDFLEFGAVIMRLIAMSWRDPQVKKELFEVEGTTQGVKVLNKWLGYNMTWNMDVKFLMSGWKDNSPGAELACRWDGDQWPQPTPRTAACRNGLHFYIPRCPEPSKPSIQAVALSAYNVTGDQYPFTCP